MRRDSSRRPGIFSLLFALAIWWKFTMPAFAGSVFELPVEEVGSLFCVDLSTSVWKEFGPTGTPLGKRVGIKMLNPHTNTGYAVGQLGTSLPSGSTSQFELEVAPGANPFQPVSPNVKLYFKTTHTAVETICGREVKQAY